MPTVWKIAPGNGACVWDDCRERKCISINWLNQTDYSEFESKKEIAKALIKAKEGKGPRKMYANTNTEFPKTETIEG